MATIKQTKIMNIKYDIAEYERLILAAKFRRDKANKNIKYHERLLKKRLILLNDIENPKKKESVKR